MSSVYRAILQAAVAKVEAVTGLSATPTVLRKEAVMVPLQDRRRQVVVAGRADLAELVGEQALGTSLGTDPQPQAVFSYEIYVLLVTEQVWDLQTLWFRLDRREEIRLALWKPILLQASVSAQYDADYDPSPQVDLSWLAGEVPLDVTCQKFVYRAWGLQHG